MAQRVVVKNKNQVVVIEAGPVGPRGLQGPPGTGGDGGASTEVRHDWVDPNDYIGVAAAGTLESASAWDIRRLAVSVDGGVTVTTAEGVKWNDRLTESYS